MTNNEKVTCVVREENLAFISCSSCSIVNTVVIVESGVAPKSKTGIYICIHGIVFVCLLSGHMWHLGSSVRLNSL
jgi:hypothetical protein